MLNHKCQSIYIAVPKTKTRSGLSLSRKRIREPTQIVRQLSTVSQELHISTINLNATLLAQVDVLFTAEWSEAPVLGHDDLLAAGELVLRAAESFDGRGAVGVASAHTQDDLADVHTCNFAVGLAEGATHTSLQSIGAGTGQHLVDADDVVRVGADAEVETFLSCNLDEVFVGADTSSFKSFGGELFVLIGDEMDAGWEFVDTGLLSAKVVNANLRVRYTTVEAGFWVWLVLAVAIASCWTSRHFFE